MRLQVVCFKWKYRGGVRLPSQDVVTYGAKHVNTLYRMVRRNLHIPFDFVCITDDYEGIDPAIRCIPLWDKHLDMGGCYNRLYVFSHDMRDLIGERFVCIDMDCVIVNDITPLFDRRESFIINSYQAQKEDTSPAGQYYNGSMFLMDAGARADVWEKFDPVMSPRQLAFRPDRVGTDQAWIREVLGPHEARWGKPDGVYEARDVQRRLPEDARIVFFSGPRDPSQSRWQWHWVKEHYQ